MERNALWLAGEGRWQKTGIASRGTSMPGVEVISPAS